MPNPLFNMLSNRQNNSQNQNVVQQFQQFINNFKGDPKQKVQELLDNGQMSTEQFTQYSNIANMLMGKHK